MMVWLPKSTVSTEAVATPLASTVPVRVSPPGPVTVNVTVPVGVPAPGGTGVTMAVRVTVSPNAVGSGEDETTVDVAAWVIVCVSAPVDPVKAASPL
ncbi:hypothetical protein ADK74_12575 [Streptomyces decoyicus]|nr:hypothetical protein ADK74_12575 [Streptomyces decoyicus]